MENAQQGLPATLRGRPGQGRAGHVRTTGADAVGKDWLSGLAIPLEKTKAVRCQRKWDWDIWGLGLGWGGGGGGNDTGSPHACSCGLCWERRAANSAPCNSCWFCSQHFQCRRRTNAGGRMREPGSAAQEAHTEEGSWRTRGADKAV